MFFREHRNRRMHYLDYLWLCTNTTTLWQNIILYKNHNELSLCVIQSKAIRNRVATHRVQSNFQTRVVYTNLDTFWFFYHKYYIAFFSKMVVNRSVNIFLTYIKKLFNCIILSLHCYSLIKKKSIQIHYNGTLKNKYFPV